LDLLQHPGHILSLQYLSHKRFTILRPLYPSFLDKPPFLRHTQRLPRVQDLGRGLFPLHAITVLAYPGFRCRQRTSPASPLISTNRLRGSLLALVDTFHPDGSPRVRHKAFTA
jgi:hypothetical protein